MKDSRPRMSLVFTGIVSHGHTHQVGGMATAKTRRRGLYYLFTIACARINYERSAVSTCGPAVQWHARGRSVSGHLAEFPGVLEYVDMLPRLGSREIKE